MTWRITMADVGERPAVEVVLHAQLAWKRLTKTQRAAIADAWTKNFLVYGNPRTLRSLQEHGFISWDPRGWGALTEAGKSVARWCAPAESTTNGGTP
jgi:hypothetical protein